jgi:hypothetical protein
MKQKDRDPLSYIYPDRGCEVEPSCLNCSLPRCKHDDPAEAQRYLRQERDRRIATVMRLEGLTVEAAAERFSVTVRTIWRSKARYRETLLEVVIP